MNVVSIFLDEDSMKATNGAYGIVSSFSDNFKEQYINKQMLLEELQKKLNLSAEALCTLPDGADRLGPTIEWQVLKSLFEEIKGI